MTKIVDVPERTVPQGVTFLNEMVTAAIYHAEHSDSDLAAKIAWAAVSAIEEEIACCNDADEVEKGIGRRGAIEAALKAGLSGRAYRLTRIGVP